jgi:S1-C subfamily serine protease
MRRPGVRAPSAPPNKSSSYGRAATLPFSFVTDSSSQTSQQSPTKLDGPEIYTRTVPSVVEITVIRRSGIGVQGNGVIVRSNGIIVTNYHVIADAVSARVKLHNGDIYDSVEMPRPMNGKT